MSKSVWSKKRRSGTAVLPGDSYLQDVETVQAETDQSQTVDLCGDCPDGDVVWATWHPFECGGGFGTKWRCQTPKIADCKKFETVGAKSVRARHPYKAGAAETVDRGIICTYDMHDMTSTPTILKEWMDYRPNSQTDGWDNSLMRDYCMSPEPNPATNCPSNPKGPCPKMLTNALCRAWADSSQHAFADGVIVDWCKVYPDSPVCTCLQREKDKGYMSVQGLFPFSDGCWYLPCKDHEMFNRLSTYDLRHPKDCPVNICEQIINIVDSNNIDLSNISMDIDCNASPKSKGVSAETLLLGSAVGVGAIGAAMIVCAFFV